MPDADSAPVTTCATKQSTPDRIAIPPIALVRVISLGVAIPAFAAADYTWEFRQHPGGSVLRNNLRFGVAVGAGCAVLTASSLIVPQVSASSVTPLCGQYQYMPVANKL